MRRRKPSLGLQNGPFSANPSMYNGFPQALVYTIVKLIALCGPSGVLCDSCAS